MEQYYCNFQYYDKKGRRLAVFCCYLNATEAELFTLTCSNQDQFDKNYARKVYEAYLNGEDLKFEFHKPVIELVEIQPERREVWTLLNYCRTKYYTFIDYDVTINVPLLYNQATGAAFGETTLKLHTL